ncbi:unnamed protein product [Phytophthora fragariaefolia]|uniref:Unnamed protein product n=1 Tax=Phytophthora fragariaefolia TaxID=1490495 RepID=A0A9W6Y4L4_9STRA|nr:unnamed protein product [Phytophthora fragariaefolia]
MASPLQSQYTTLSHFQRAHATLSDSVIGHVLPRRQTGKRYLCSDSDEAPWNSLHSEQEPSREVFVTGEERPAYLSTPPYQTSTVSLAMAHDERRRDEKGLRKAAEPERTGEVVHDQRVNGQCNRNESGAGAATALLALLRRAADSTQARGICGPRCVDGLSTTRSYCVRLYASLCVPASGEVQQE